MYPVMNCLWLHVKILTSGEKPTDVLTGSGMCYVCWHYVNNEVINKGQLEITL